MTIRKILWYLCALCLTIGSLILGGVIALIITVVMVLAVQGLITKMSRPQSAPPGPPESGPPTQYQ